MKKVIFTFFALAAIWHWLPAQSELIIEPGAPGVINSAIAGDTLPNGDRIDPNRVYVLRRGFPYVLTGSIEFSDFHLHIKAEEGDGARPYLLVDSGADPVSQIFRINGTGDLTMEGIHLSGRDILGSYNNRLLRINSDDSRIVIDDCIWTECGQAGFRVQGDNPKIYLTNSHFNRMGRPTNPDNGRFIDNRGVPVDTLWIENCFIDQVTSRWYRDGSGSSINWARLNQNTFWSSGQYGFSFGEIQNLEMTNNIVYNGIFLGRPAEGQDTLADARFVVMIDTFIDGETNILVSHNNFHLDQELIDNLPATDNDGNELVSMENFVFDLQVQAAIDATGTGDTNLDEELEFFNAPVTPTQFVIAVAQDTSGGNEVPEAGPWDMSNLTADPDLSQLTSGVDRYRTMHDYAYSFDALSRTAGDEGQAIGADQSGFTPASELFVENNILFYPNPVVNQLVIQNLNEAALDRVMILDLTGKVIQSFAARDAITTVDLSSLPPGTYLLTLVDEQGTVSSRKIIKH